MDFEQEVERHLFYIKSSAVLVGIVILPLLILWITSLYQVRRENDPARVAFTYMKVAFALAILTSISQSAHLALKIAVLKKPASRAWDDFPDHLNDLSTRLEILSTALLDVTDIFLILTLFELGNGFLICFMGKRSSAHLVIRYITLVPSAVILYLTIATYLKGFSTWSKILCLNEDNEQRVLNDFEELEAWDTPLLVVWSIASVLLFAYASFVVRKARDKPLLLSSAMIFLVATILNLTNPVRHLAVVILGLDKDVYLLTGDYYIADTILDYWVRLFTLVLVFIVGVRNDDGLWTTAPQQPESTKGECDTMQKSEQYEEFLEGMAHDEKEEKASQG
ncbi:hypothetical protein B0J13DRAFT_576222 [Dactylonectria estremocensis]|uniref:Uncharacterized protein n=1 Tax=Dactylonectria estremocensis TaxID=1079267 RepID=A0A9P9I9W8_9HYPO|nr:hypothetical protein B0J13DRAFT_576222 [Dactylonectria estremocensis]